MENLKAVVGAVVSNLAYAVVSGHQPPAFAVSLQAARRATTRYDRKGFTALPSVLEALGGVGVLSLNRSERRGLASTVTASAALVATLHAHPWADGVFGEAPGRETIWLSREERDLVGPPASLELLDYPDHAMATRFRREVATINAVLQAADLTVVDDDGGGLWLGPCAVTSAKRAVRRQFKATEAGAVRFDRGGRLFGAWWMHLPKRRLAALRIDGEPTVEVGLPSLLLRLAYAEAGASQPPADPYASIAGLSGLRWRPGVERVVSAMLFRASPLVRLPAAATGLLPAETTGKAARAAILAAHPALAPVFESGVGLRLVFRESQILVAALLRLTGEGISALPLRNSLICAGSKAGAVALALREAAEAEAGSRLPVTLKASA